MMRNFSIILILSFVLTVQITAALDKTDGSDPEVDQIGAAAKDISAVLPDSNPNIIFIEGEDAISTNFNREPILNYSCSGYRTLQLNEELDPPEGSLYFADFVFYAEQDGTYELWYGGTPPGNRDELLPSYASPFKLTLDEYYENEIYREDMHVVSNYAPAYYWNYVKDITISKGEHRLRFEIPVRRAYDNKYFFYLDNFFLVKKENGERNISGSLPKVFPVDPNDRSIDNPFKSLEDYQILIRDNPENSGNYVEISMVYSLIGDYLNALKNLRKALLLEPDNPDIKLLIAKNLIWKGAFYDGLEEYRDLLMIVPEKLDYWMEAGKVAAWIGQYKDSVDFFKEGLEYFPNNLNLLANLGITYLWTADEVNAGKIFKQLDLAVGDNVEQFIDLANVFLVNGYPQKAVEIYRKAIHLHPEYLEFYFLLEDAYLQAGEKDKVPGVRHMVEETFIKTSELEKVLQVFYNKQEMKEEVIEKYKTDLANDPDNLILRKTLAETYFWNGYKEEAIAEYLNILTNYTYRSIRETEKDLSRFLELLDKSYVFYNFLKKIPAYISRSKKELSAAFSVYTQSLNKLETLKSKNEKMKEKGEKVSSDDENILQQNIDDAEEKLASLITAKEIFIEKYMNLKDQFKDDKEYLNRLMEDEKSKVEAFNKLTEGSRWQWDRDSMLQELEIVKENGMPLANFDLGVIFQFEGDLSSAKENLKYSSAVKTVKGAAYALFQTDLWMGNEKESQVIYQENQEAIESVTDYIPDLIEYIKYLSTDDEEVFGFLSDDPAGNIKKITEEYNTINADLKMLSKESTENIRKIHSFLNTMMTQRFYNLAENTYLLRNELGDFYQNQKKYPEAIVQYKQVLAIEPWDISAKYKLGQVYHRNGDWSKAQELYREVYEEDPVYGNVTAFYNQLAKEHSDHLIFTGSTFADTSQISFTGDTQYRMNINGTFSFMADYTVNYTLYPASAALYAPTSLLNSFSIGIPLSFNRFILKPNAGISLESDLVDQDTRAGYDTNSTPLDFFSTYNLYPFGGVEMEISAGPVIVTAGYKYNWMAETFHPEDTPVSFQTGSGSVQIDFGFIKKPVIQNTGLSVSGYLQFLDDNNSIFGVSSEVNNYFLILDKPETTFGITGSFSWESSKIDSLNSPSYWLPVDSYRGGGAVSVSSEFDLNRDISFSDDLRFYSGYYSDDTGNGLALELSNVLNYNRKDFSGYLKLSGTMKGNFEYWSFTIEFGADAGLPDLLSL